MARRIAHHYYHTLRLRELRRLYWAHTVKELGSNMVSIFVPIYLYRLHYSISAILAYFLLGTLFWGLSQTWLLQWSSRIGFNRAMGFSLILEGLQILLLATLPHYHWPLWLLALIWGLSLSLYWPQFRACFTKSLLHRNVAPAAGLSSALLMFAFGIAPALGGAIASGLGIAALYVVAIGCFLAAAVPLLVGEELVKNQVLRVREVPWRRAWRDFVANTSSEVDEEIAFCIWPLLIFFLVPSYLGVGLLSSVMVIASIIIALYVGRRRLNSMAGFLNGGTNAVTLTNVVRLLPQSIGLVAGINFFYGLGQALIATPFYSRYYHNAEQEPLLPYVYGMNISCAAGDVVLFGSLLLLSLVVPAKTVLVIGLIIAVPVSYAIRLIRAPQERLLPTAG